LLLGLIVGACAIPLASAPAQAAGSTSCTVSGRVVSCTLPVDTLVDTVAVHDTVTVVKTVTVTQIVHDTVRIATTAPAPTPVLAPTDPHAEPVFDATHQTLLVRDDMNYTSFADAEAQGWRCTNSSTTQDVSTNPQGACQLTTGSDGSGRALHLVYDGIANAAGQEGHSWNRRLADTLNSLPGHTLYLSYDFRITPGGGFTLDDGTHILQVKWLELWDQTDRAQFNTQYQTCYDNVPQGPPVNGGTIWTFYGNGGGTTQCNAGQVRPPFAYQGQGQWHRATYRYVTRSSSTATDGVAQMWVDGTLILSVRASDCGVPVPGAVGDAATGRSALPMTMQAHFPAIWCNAQDLNAMFVRQHTFSLSFGNVSATRLWPFAIDIDHLALWRD